VKNKKRPMSPIKGHEYSNVTKSRVNRVFSQGLLDFPSCQSLCPSALTKIAHRCYRHELTATCLSHHETMQMFNKGRGEDETAISGEGG
jgi:hypothetical protein